MRAIEHPVEEEPAAKKARMIDKIEKVPMLLQNESAVDVMKETCVASADGSENGQLTVAEEKDTCVEQVESNEKKICVDVMEETCVASGDGSENGQLTVAEEKDACVEQVVSNEKKICVDVMKETCVASGDGSENGQVCNITVAEEKDTCVEQVESNEKKIVEVSALSLADREHVDTKENQDLLVEENQVDVVSGDANIEKLPVLELEKINDASVTPAVTSIDEIPQASYVASGGIEEVSRSNPSVAGKKLLVLDLNGLLADIVSVSPLLDCKADINIGRRAIFKRPFCEDFLKFCFDKFEVGIWSSRNQNNVDRITEFLLGDMKSKLLFCWGMSYCATTTVGSLENRHKVVVFKNLNQLWEKHDPKLPWIKGDYNETNTVLLDDSPYKALLNPPYTAIFPHSYSHQNKDDISLGNGGDLRLYLEKLVEAENVQDFIKKNPFGQEAITEASESWEFYRQAIHSYAYIRI